MFELKVQNARNLWMQAQWLVGKSPATGPDEIIRHLGYVQIDTIHVIERAHHHILWSRLPTYRKKDLVQAQSDSKNVFEYWTHALSYVHVDDYRYFMKDMSEFTKRDNTWYSSVTEAERKRVLKMVREGGALTMRDLKDEPKIEKLHDWSSKKPSKRVLECLFYCGKLVISKRSGMLKEYELAERHFTWDQPPKPAKEPERIAYLLERGLRTQGVVSLESLSHLRPKMKPIFLAAIEKEMKTKKLIEVKIENIDLRHWMRPETLETLPERSSDEVHILSPFDPLVIQRKRLKHFFDYEHLFEAYLPKEKRKFGYFTLPVFCNDKVVALLDLKTSREDEKVLIQKWSWIKGCKSAEMKVLIEEKLEDFEAFQLDLPNTHK